MGLFNFGHSGVCAVVARCGTASKHLCVSLLAICIFFFVMYLFKSLAQCRVVCRFLIDSKEFFMYLDRSPLSDVCATESL